MEARLCGDPGGPQELENVDTVTGVRKVGRVTMEERIDREAIRRDPPEIMNVEGLAAYLGLSVRTVYNMAHDGEVPGTKV